MSPGGHVSPVETLKQSALEMPRALGAHLFVVLNGDAARAHRLDRPMTLGRDPACEVPLASDHAASRQHARLAPSTGGEVVIEDLDSKNGTFVDGAPVERVELATGSVVRVGDTIGCLVTTGEEWQAGSSEGPLCGGVSLAGVRRLIGLVGPSEMPVLVTGATGTGKEVVARLLHQASRRPGPFIPVNCAALPEALVESELFGHARGAFTGAGQARRGLFAAAAGGTLFFDEVGELPLPAQAKLLRVLEDRMVRAVGAEIAQPVDVRILSATNRELTAAVEAGQFRADLLGRLAMVEVRTPLLSERREDIPPLCAHLLARAGHAATPISPDALEALLLHDWPRNIRELEAVLRGAVLAGPTEIGFHQLPEPIRGNVLRRRSAGAARRSARAAPKHGRQELMEALTSSSGNVRRASRALGISRGHAYRLLDRWSIDLGSFRGAGAGESDDEV
jgi:DNA-binding NtrC family response regulator